MERLLLLALLIIFIDPVAAETQNKATNIFVELGGTAYLYSINIDQHASEQISLRVGFALYNNGAIIPVLPTFHVMASKNLFLEIGGGILLITSRGDNDKNSYLTGSLGLRVQSNNGINFRLVFTPLYLDNHSSPWGGISFGYSF